MFCLEKLILHLFYLLCNAAISTDTNLKIRKTKWLFACDIFKTVNGLG